MKQLWFVVSFTFWALCSSAISRGLPAFVRNNWVTSDVGRWWMLRAVVEVSDVESCSSTMTDSVWVYDGMTCCMSSDGDRSSRLASATGEVQRYNRHARQMTPQCRWSDTELVSCPRDIRGQQGRRQENRGPRTPENRLTSSEQGSTTDAFQRQILFFTLIVFNGAKHICLWQSTSSFFVF